MEILTFGDGKGIRDIVERGKETSPQIPGCGSNRRRRPRLVESLHTTAEKVIEHLSPTFFRPLSHGIKPDQQVVIDLDRCSHTSEHRDSDA